MTKTNPGDDEGYQGWTNYETWAVQLWLSNEEPLYRRFSKAAKSVAGDHTSLRAASVELGRAMRDFAEGEVLESRHYKALPGFARDLLNASLGEVDWDEIAAAWLDDYEFAEDGDEEEADDTSNDKENA